jgi:O-antigen ligase
MSITAVVFFAIYFGLLLAALVKRPFFGLCAYLMVFYLNPPARWWGDSLPDFRWSFIAAVVTLLAIFIKGGRLESLRFKETWFYIVFFAFVVMQTVWAKDLSIHLEFVGMVFNFLMLIFLIQGSVRDEKDLIWFILIMLLGCSYFTYIGMTSVWGGRLDGIGGPAIASANQMAQHVAAVLYSGVFLTLLKSRRWYEYAVVMVLLFFCVKVIMMAGSRGVYLAIVLTGIFVLLFPAQGSRRRLYVLAGLAVGSAMIFVAPTVMQRFKDLQLTQLSEADDKSARSRIFIARGQVEMFKDAPLLGHGHKGTLLLSPIYIAPEYLTRSGSGEQSGRASHNYFLSLLVDHGLVGASFILLIIYRCLIPLGYLSRARLVGRNDDIRILLMGLIMGLLCLMLAGISSDHKNSETSIWFFALIPLFLDKLKRGENAD